MRLQQIRLLCEIIDHGFNVSKAATALHTSQPGVSRQIQFLATGYSGWSSWIDSHQWRTVD
jgi:LysR family cys regulon transcriptional activator